EVAFGGETNVGLKRQHNEERYFIPDGDRIAIVADGMGGHASGEVASRLAVETVAQHFRDTAEEAELTWPYKLEHTDRHDANRLVCGVKLANLEVYERGQRDEACHGMGTTVVAL